MNIRNKNILKAFALLLLCVIVGSCSQDELGTGNGNPLPPGKYPLMFTATVDGMMSRAEGENEPWIDGDKIAAQIVGYSFAGHYVLNPDGSVKESDDPLAWPVDEGFVRAWYPSEKLPISKQIGDQSEGYHHIDFLYAETEETKRYNKIVDLLFKHQMAKVTCILSKGDGVTEEDLKTAKVSYYGYTEAQFSATGVSGVGENGLITPTSDFTALLVPQNMSGKEFIKVVLDVTVNNITNTKTWIYTPTPEDSILLKAGSAYTFNITVQKDRLEVEPITAEWNDEKGEGAKADLSRINLPDLPDELRESLEFSHNASLMHDEDKNIDYLLVQGFVFTISYKAELSNPMNGFLLPDQTDLLPDETPHKMTRTEDDGDYELEFKLARQVPEGIDLGYGDYAQVGDYYYDDGTWGLYHPNAYSEKNPGGNKIIGIVFKAGSSGTDDKLDNYIDEDWKTKPNHIRGYVVALNDASTVKGIWLDFRNSRIDPDSKTNQNHKIFCPPASTKYENTPYSGYINTNIIRTEGPNGPSGWNPKAIYDTTVDTIPDKGFWAFKVASEYKPAAPESSSGWYLPSARQWDDLRNIFGLRSYFEEAGGTNFSDSDGEYWTSTEYNHSNAWICQYNLYKMYNVVKTQPNKYVRSVLTF